MSGAKSTSSWIAGTLALNVGLAAALFGVYAVARSRLVLAQGADSLMDIVAVGALAVVAFVARRPRDAGHPFGHARAEPLGALLVAALAGVLAYEVGESAVRALLRREPAPVDAAVAAALGLKIAAKLGLVAVLAARARRGNSPALRAVVVDARNDVAAAGSSLLGYAAARAGLGWADAALAIPLCVYIAFNGFKLARENVGYLMGEAPPEDVLADLRVRAERVAGVLHVPAVEAHFVGSELHVEVTVVVREDATAREAHAVGIAVQGAVETAELVGRAFVHLDTEPPAGPVTSGERRGAS